MRALGVGVLAVAMAASSAAWAKPRVPAEFLGEWNQVAAACQTGESDSLIRIAPDEVAFYESAGPITKVRRHSRREITIESDPAVGESDDWRWAGSVRVRLAADGTLEQQNGDDWLTMHRCPD